MKFYHPPACPGVAKIGLVIALPFVKAFQRAENRAQGVLQGPSLFPLQQRQSWCHRALRTRAAAGHGGACRHGRDGVGHPREGRAADIVLLCLQLSRWDLEGGLSPKRETPCTLLNFIILIGFLC